MVRFQKLLHFSIFHFPKEYESAEAGMNFSCLNFWATLRCSVLSNAQPFLLSPLFLNFDTTSPTFKQLRKALLVCASILHGTNWKLKVWSFQSKRFKGYNLNCLGRSTGYLHDLQFWTATCCLNEFLTTGKTKQRVSSSMKGEVDNELVLLVFLKSVLIFFLSQK